MRTTSVSTLISKNIFGNSFHRLKRRAEYMIRVYTNMNTVFPQHVLRHRIVRRRHCYHGDARLKGIVRCHEVFYFIKRCFFGVNHYRISTSFDVSLLPFKCLVLTMSSQKSLNARDDHKIVVASGCSACFDFLTKGVDIFQDLNTTCTKQAVLF